jgi:hypothetical protein
MTRMPMLVACTSFVVLGQSGVWYDEEASGPLSDNHLVSGFLPNPEKCSSEGRGGSG